MGVAAVVLSAGMLEVDRVGRTTGLKVGELGADLTSLARRSSGVLASSGGNSSLDCFEPSVADDGVAAVTV